MSAEATGRGTLTMTPKEVAERLGIPEWRVREQVRRGRVPHLRFGRHRIALLPEHVDAIIELVTVEPAGRQVDDEAAGAPGSARVRQARASLRQAPGVLRQAPRQAIRRRCARPSRPPTLTADGSMYRATGCTSRRRPG